jgi:hypothetical protein
MPSDIRRNGIFWTGRIRFLPGKNVSRPSIAPVTLAIQHAGKESNTQEWQSTDAAFRGYHCKRPVSALVALPVVGLPKSRTSQRKRGLVPKFQRAKPQISRSYECQHQRFVL